MNPALNAYKKSSGRNHTATLFADSLAFGFRTIAKQMTQMKPKLSLLENLFTIHRFPANHSVPEQIYESNFYSISKTEDELSIVCDSSILLNSEKTETGWSCIKVLGPLDFSLTGILADISTVLSKAEISIFALSTFDTDYILVKSEQILFAKDALLVSGYTFK